MVAKRSNSPKRKVNKKVRDYGVRNWFLTWNNYPEDWQEVLSKIGGLSKWCCQPEVGESGTPHIQGVLVFKSAKMFSSLVRVAAGKISWRKARNLAACKNYCSKVDTRAGAMWTKGFRFPLKIKDPLADKVLYDWQQEIVELVKTAPDDRKIYWYWSDRGNIGKSALVKHLCLKDPDSTVLCGGNFKDAEFAISQKVTKGEDVSLVLFDIPRSRMKDGQVLVSYQGMEEIKNGCFFSPKYESKMVILNVPHVIVFSNNPPDEFKLSQDRWVIKNLD